MIDEEDNSLEDLEHEENHEGSSIENENLDKLDEEAEDEGGWSEWK